MYLKAWCYIHTASCLLTVCAVDMCNSSGIWTWQLSHFYALPQKNCKAAEKDFVIEVYSPPRATSFSCSPTPFQSDSPSSSSSLPSSHRCSKPCQQQEEVCEYFMSCMSIIVLCENIGNAHHSLSTDIGCDWYWCWGTNESEHCFILSPEKSEFVMCICVL